MCVTKAGDYRTTEEEKPGDQNPQSVETDIASRRNGKQSDVTDHLLWEIESLRTRLSKLSEASRRVSEDLDLNVVLAEVIDNARYLTGARYGALLTYEQSGDIQDFITSGLSPEEMQLLNTSPKGLGLLGYMNEIREPLRLADIASHPSSVGFPENHPPMKTFLGMPIRHRGHYVGNIYLTEKDGGQEFTSEDQDTLVMFASQAGAAIFNARRYREEHQARANLEALLALTPVGMLVVDAVTRKVESVNSEAERIIGVGAGVSLDEFRDRASYGLPDGQELPIERHPLQAALQGRDTIQAVEIVFEAPGGQRINCLINAKAIRSELGDLVSAVGTILDMTPLEDMKRQRAEFLQNVSHELRTPLSAIKGSTSTILGSPSALASAETRQFLRVIDEQAEHMRHLINDLVDLTQIEAGSLSVNTEPKDVANLLDQARERYLHAGRRANLEIEIDVPADLPRVLADEIRIIQVLDNLLSHASAHSTELVSIRISAVPLDDYVAFSVDSEGAGVTPLRTSQETGWYATTSDQFIRTRHRRDDLAIALCKGIVEAHGGRLAIKGGESTRSIRATFTIPAERGMAGHDEKGSSNSFIIHGPKGGKARVLAVTDDPETPRYVRSAFAGAELIQVRTCVVHDADRFIEADNPHVVLVEPLFPLDDGLELLQRIHRVSEAPIILMAGNDWGQHIGHAFELGAFDYIAKPFTSTELVARIELAFRKGKYAYMRELSGSYVFGDLLIDHTERRVTVAGHPVHLTTTEYKLLAELSAAMGRVLSHEQLLRRVWGPLYANDQRVVRTYIKELRRKLGDNAKRPTYIFTEPGVGYRMAKPSRG